MDYEITKLPKISAKSNIVDSRGYLIEFLKRTELEKNSQSFAQIYCATIAPNTIRGNHYHKKKEETFSILSGKVILVLEDINTKERKEIIMDASEDYITRVRFGIHIAHTIKNISDEMVFLIAHSTEIYESGDDVEYKLSL